MMGNNIGTGGTRYINAAIRNVGNVKKREFKPFFNAISDADCIILAGEGRSQSALYIGIGQMEKEVKTMTDIDFPGSNILEAAPVLENKYDKIALLVNSGSGETATPKIIVKQLTDYIERKKSEKFTINAVVSNTSSSIGKITDKEYGNVVELKGRDTKTETKNGFLKHGIMNDIYELGSLLLFQKMKEAINGNRDYKAVFRKIETESKLISRIVNRFVCSDIYEDILDRLETRSRITMGGVGPARNVAKMTAIRLQHVKRAIGDEAYLSGAFAPKPRAGDILFLISLSGETEPLLDWCKEQKKFGGHVYSIVGTESRLSKESDSFIIDNTPDMFYERVAFALSPLPLHLVERLYKRGFMLPKYVLELLQVQHSMTE